MWFLRISLGFVNCFIIYKILIMTMVVGDLYSSRNDKLSWLSAWIASIKPGFRS